MAIINLGTLQTACESWMERTLDDSLFLEFAAEVTNVLNYGLRALDDRSWVVPPLRSRKMVTTTTLSVSSAQASLPADWLEFQRLWINTNTGRDLIYTPQDSFASYPLRDESGEPTVYTIDDELVRFAPTTDAVVQATYVQKLSELTGDSSTNVALTNHPHIYRHGCLWKAFDWEGNRERSDRELQFLSGGVKALNVQKNQAQTRGVQLRMRPGSVA
jgi:hypothetical protein